MSTSEILNGYISDIENRIGFTLNQSTGLYFTNETLSVTKKTEFNLFKNCINS